MFKNDLGYTLKDRNKNAERIINFVHFLNQQDINLIISANLTSQKYRLYCKKNFKKILRGKYFYRYKNVKKKEIVKKFIKIKFKNVVGYGIKNIKNNTAYLKIKNNGSKKKFLNYSKEIIKKLINS